MASPSSRRTGFIACGAVLWIAALTVFAFTFRTSPATPAIVQDAGHAVHENKDQRVQSQGVHNNEEQHVQSHGVKNEELHYEYDAQPPRASVKDEGTRIGGAAQSLTRKMHWDELVNHRVEDGAEYPFGEVDPVEDECDVFLDNIVHINTDPMLLDMIRDQEEECGCYSAADWKRLRAEAAQAVYERRNVMLFAHISKTGGTVITQTVRDGNRTVPKGLKLNGEIGGLGPKIDGWPYMPTAEQERVLREWHDRPGDYASREFGLTRTNLLCPGDVVAYFGTIRHAYRRIQSLITKWNVDPKIALEPAKQTEDGRHKVRDHTVAWYSGFSHSGKVYVPMNQTTLDMAKWRWCALFSGSIAVDQGAAKDWDDLMFEKFGVQSHLPDCEAPNPEIPSSHRTHAASGNLKCPKHDPYAEDFFAKLPPQQQDSARKFNHWDNLFWEFQMRTRLARNTEPRAR